MGHPKRWSLVYQALSFLSQLASASRLLGMTKGRAVVFSWNWLVVNPIPWRLRETIDS